MDDGGALGPHHVQPEFLVVVDLAVLDLHDVGLVADDHHAALLVLRDFRVHDVHVRKLADDPDREERGVPLDAGAGYDALGPRLQNNCRDRDFVELLDEFQVQEAVFDEQFPIVMHYQAFDVVVEALSHDILPVGV